MVYFTLANNVIVFHEHNTEVDIKLFCIQNYFLVSAQLHLANWALEDENASDLSFFWR